MQFSIHYKALMRKNYILWKRNWCCSIFEVLLPVILVSFFFLIRAKITIKDIDQASFMTYDPKSEKVSIPYTIWFYWQAIQEQQEPVYTELVPDYELLTNPLTGQVFPPFMKDCLTGSTNDYPDFRNGHIALIDDSGLLTSLADIFENYYNYEVKKYPSVKALDDWVTSADYKQDVCLGIFMEQFKDNKYKYRLYFNSSDEDEIEIPISNFPSVLEYFTQQIKNHFLPWRDSGFLTIQNWIGIIIYRFWQMQEEI